METYVKAVQRIFGAVMPRNGRIPFAGCDAERGEGVMRSATIVGVLAVALAGCTATPVSNSVPARGTLPLDIGNGTGSQYGNYEMRPASETRDAAGNRCVVFNWDRPLNKNFAIRYSSASCESKDHPIWMNTTSYTRIVIPISESSLNGQ